jgi:hypothetical protein
MEMQQVVYRCSGQSLNDGIYSSTKRSRQPVSQKVSQPASQPASQSASQSVSQSIS